MLATQSHANGKKWNANIVSVHPSKQAQLIQLQSNNNATLRALNRKR
jgi:hypothetical protein